MFEHATTFGSLIQVPEGLAEKLPALKKLSEATSQDLFVSEALKRLGPAVQQAESAGDAVRRGGGESAVYGKQVSGAGSQEVSSRVTTPATRRTSSLPFSSETSR